jgi:hypothetical protein
MKNSLKYYIVLFLLICSNTFSQDLRFIREDINFTLSDSSFYVDGYYWFVNNSGNEIERMIYFPFCSPGEDAIVDSAGVSIMPEAIEKNVLSKTGKGFYFNIKLEAGDTAVYNIKYRQILNGDSAKYILLSTKTWNMPLELAEYKLIVKPPVNVTGFSYTPDKEYIINGEKIYYWKRTGFMPEKDMIFTFKK